MPRVVKEKLDLVQGAVLKADPVDGKESVSKAKFAILIQSLNAVNEDGSFRTDLQTDVVEGKVSFEPRGVEDLSLRGRRRYHRIGWRFAWSSASHSHPYRSPTRHFS